MRTKTFIIIIIVLMMIITIFTGCVFDGTPTDEEIDLSITEKYDGYDIIGITPSYGGSESAKTMLVVTAIDGDNNVHLIYIGPNNIIIIKKGDPYIGGQGGTYERMLFITKEDLVNFIN